MCVKRATQATLQYHQRGSFFVNWIRSRGARSRNPLIAVASRTIRYVRHAASTEEIPDLLQQEATSVWADISGRRASNRRLKPRRLGGRRLKCPGPRPNTPCSRFGSWFWTTQLLGTSEEICAAFAALMDIRGEELRQPEGTSLGWVRVPKGTEEAAPKPFRPLGGLP